ncbi:MAG: dsRNA-specific ribonuclease [Candidatus Lokiarchaeota archaeon]|nr:dsRNA-specific ribonuclease [Candidatus Lokiarchaeota archaeon]
MSLQESLGYKFKNENLLDRALTRKAHASEQKQKNIPCEDQEIYRTLGDAVLKAILVDHLIRSGSATREDITNKKMKIEAEYNLSEASKKIGIGQMIILGSGEKKQHAENIPKVLAETLEAIVGAIYLDGGYDTAMKVVKGWITSHLLSE